MSGQFTPASRGEVTEWIQQLESESASHRDEAARNIVSWYIDDLRGLVAVHLSDRLQSRVGISDILQDAFFSFFRGTFDVVDRDSLRVVLVTLVLNRTRTMAQFHSALKRKQGREIISRQSPFDSAEIDLVDQAVEAVKPQEIQKGKYRRNLDATGLSTSDSFDRDVVGMMSYGATPDQAAEISEMITQLPEKLLLVAILAWKGHSTAEIAREIGRSTKTVDRYLSEIRAIWTRSPDE